MFNVQVLTSLVSMQALNKHKKMHDQKRQLIKDVCLKGFVFLFGSYYCLILLVFQACSRYRLGLILKFHKNKTTRKIHDCKQSRLTNLFAILNINQAGQTESVLAWQHFCSVIELVQADRTLQGINECIHFYFKLKIY